MLKGPVGPILCALIVVVLDQVSKASVLSQEVFNAEACLNRDIPCGHIALSPIFDLTMVWNRGVSFGLLRSGGGVFLFLGAAAISVGFALWMVKARPVPVGYALALIVGGATGNLIDRARFSAVIDFLDFSGLYFPFVFNLADACITIGAICLVVVETLAREPKQE